MIENKSEYSVLYAIKNDLKYRVYIGLTLNIHFYLSTIFPISLDPFYIVSYYKNWVMTSWTYMP